MTTTTPDGNPATVYSADALARLLRERRPKAWRWLDRLLLGTPRRAIYTLDFLDFDIDPARHYRMSEEEIEAVRWLRARLGGADVLHVVKWC